MTASFSRTRPRFRLPASIVSRLPLGETPVRQTIPYGAGRDVGDRAVVIRGAQVSHQAWFGSVGGAVQHVNVEAALYREQCRQETDRSGAGDQGGARFEPGPFADQLYLLPGLCDDRGWFHQHSALGQCGGQFHRVRRLDAPLPAGVAVKFLDASFGVAAVAAQPAGPGRVAPSRSRRQ